MEETQGKRHIVREGVQCGKKCREGVHGIRGSARGSIEEGVHRSRKNMERQGSCCSSVCLFPLSSLSLPPLPFLHDIPSTGLHESTLIHSLYSSLDECFFSPSVYGDKNFYF